MVAVADSDVLWGSGQPLSANPENSATTRKLSDARARSLTAPGKHTDGEVLGESGTLRSV
ncbi:hypothetical protein CUN61_21090 [Pseudomonas arsenicoxydans]|uniref:Uncharacterized protein n=1 Tax=Pseudomonas arsenicoxydans TaxID=702115 RepID=A0A4P6G9J6_9PSED|nr:hypothetical protein CUN61_21090 [Pseudomonas arsenicoxydans]